MATKQAFQVNCGCLRILEVSNATNCGNVIQNPKGMRGLLPIHLRGKAMYLADAVKQWLQQRVTCGR